MATKGKVVISCAVTGSSTLSASDNGVCTASIGFWPNTNSPLYQKG
jgi:hypothetical protein